MWLGLGWLGQQAVKHTISDKPKTLWLFWESQPVENFFRSSQTLSNKLFCSELCTPCLFKALSRFQSYVLYSLGHPALTFTNQLSRTRLSTNYVVSGLADMPALKCWLWIHISSCSSNIKGTISQVVQHCVLYLYQDRINPWKACHPSNELKLSSLGAFKSSQSLIKLSFSLSADFFTFFPVIVVTAASFNFKLETIIR